MDIYKKFISISFEKFIFLEFIKNKPILEKEMTFLILNKKIIIEIIII